MDLALPVGEDIDNPPIQSGIHCPLPYKDIYAILYGAPLVVYHLQHHKNMQNLSLLVLYQYLIYFQQHCCAATRTVFITL